MTSKTEEVEIEGVRLTSPGRILYEEQGITKLELAEYYREIAEWVVPSLANRPLTLVRCPQGPEKQCFVQRRAGDAFPDYLRRVPLGVDEKGEEAVHVAVDSLKGILYLVQIGVLEFHVWGARRDRLDRPDRLILDLDPDPRVSWERVVEAANELRARLAGLGLESWVRTTGGKGLHVVAPLARTGGWDELRAFSRALAEEMEGRDPSRYIAEASKAERVGKIFVDYLRNGWGSTAIASYSTRSRPGAPVATPVSWDELEAGAKPHDFTVLTVPDRLRALNGRDPWDGFAESRQSLTRSIRKALRVD